MVRAMIANPEIDLIEVEFYTGNVAQAKIIQEFADWAVSAGRIVRFSKEECMMNTKLYVERVPTCFAEKAIMPL